MSKARTDALVHVPVLDDDLAFNFPLPPRDPSWLNEPGTAPVSRGILQQWTRAFVDTLETLKRTQGDADKAAGVLVHTLGTYLRQFRGHSAWVALGYDTYEEFCEGHLRISVRHANRVVFFAAITTEEQAAFGLSKCLAGFALAQALGAGGLEALIPTGPRWKEPAEWAARLGEPVAFVGSTARRLERLVKKLTQPALSEAPTPEVADVVEVRKKVIDRVARRHPALLELDVRSYARDGEARIHNNRPAVTDAEFAALEALYKALRRKK